MAVKPVPAGIISSSINKLTFEIYQKTTNLPSQSFDSFSNFSGKSQTLILK